MTVPIHLTTHPKHEVRISQKYTATHIESRTPCLNFLTLHNLSPTARFFARFYFYIYIRFFLFYLCVRSNDVGLKTSRPFTDSRKLLKRSPGIKTLMDPSRVCVNFYDEAVKYVIFILKINIKLLTSLPLFVIHCLSKYSNSSCTYCSCVCKTTHKIFDN